MGMMSEVKTELGRGRSRRRRQGQALRAWGLGLGWGALVFAGLASSSCAEKTATLELDSADRALAAARERRAQDCAPEIQRAAEEALAEARQLAADGDVDAARSKAGQAETLANQAAAASPPGCENDVNKEDVAGDGGPTNAIGEATLAAASPVELEAALETIYFDYNKAVIRDDSQEVLTRVAEVLRRMPSHTLEIEGHCDVRGSTEYNLHLGERRARSVMKYLVTQGVSPEQLRIISYGEERPADFGFGDDAHSANRRAELRRL